MDSNVEYDGDLYHTSCAGHVVFGNEEYDLYTQIVLSYCVMFKFVFFAIFMAVRTNDTDSSHIIGDNHLSNFSSLR